MLFAIKTIANQDVGTGHIFRQSQISKELEAKGHKVRFLLNKSAESRRISKLLKLDAVYDENKLLREHFDAFLIDTLKSRADFVKKISKTGSKVITFDDRGAGVWHCDICICPLFAPLTRQPKWSKTKVFAEYKYLVLNADFKKIARIKPVSKKVSRVVLTQGGTDTYGLVPYLVSSLAQVDNLVFDVVVGSAFVHRKNLNAAIGSYRNVNVHGFDNFKNLLLKCDLAISAGGLSVFEILSLGIATVSVTAEPKEIEVLKRLSKDNLVLDLGYIAQNMRNEETAKKIRAVVSKMVFNFPLRKKYGRNAQAKVRGSGVYLVCSEILKLTDAA